MAKQTLAAAHPQPGRTLRSGDDRRLQPAATGSGVTLQPLGRTFAIRVEKEHLKFSAAHFLIFADGSAERLHGHNYRVAVDLEATGLEHGLLVDFATVKRQLAAILAPLDERFLVPGRHPALSIEHGDDEIKVRFCRRRYVVPADEVALLPIANTSSECLAEHLAGELHTALSRVAPSARWSRIAVEVEETAGQRGICTLRP